MAVAELEQLLQVEHVGHLVSDAVMVDDAPLSRPPCWLRRSH